MHALQDWRVAARRIGELHALAFLEGSGGGTLAALGELRLVIPLKRVFRLFLRSVTTSVCAAMSTDLMIPCATAGCVVSAANNSAGLRERMQRAVTAIL